MAGLGFQLSPDSIRPGLRGWSAAAFSQWPICAVEVSTGEEWHRQAILANKQKVFDDFIAAAEWLIAQKYTSTPKLAIEGGSNGGLLIGAY